LSCDVETQRASCFLASTIPQIQFSKTALDEIASPSGKAPSLCAYDNYIIRFLGARRPGQQNLLIRVTLRSLDGSISKEEANRVYDLVYAKLHEGTAGYFR
jgi:hypothetical protein